MEPRALTQDSGILPAQDIRELIDAGHVRSSAGGLDTLVQPASLDLTLGSVAYRVRASFLPGKGVPVADRVAALNMHSLDLTGDTVLEVGCVYIVPLSESLALPSEVWGLANPKSSTGRLNVFTRLIADGTTVFDRVPAGYDGPLYAEIAPNAFSIKVRQGDRLNQLRFKRGSQVLSDPAHRRLDQEHQVFSTPDGGEAEVREGLVFTVDLSGDNASGLAGFRAKRHAGVIDLARIGAYDPREFWDPLAPTERRDLILDPNEFYILASREFVRIPPDCAAEMVPYDVQVGEFRVHYAGFFDPGFGWDPNGGPGTKAVLEVRSHEVPFLLEHGQAVGRLVYDRLAAIPNQLYGSGIGSSYHGQSLTLSKHFRPWTG